MLGMRMSISTTSGGAAWTAVDRLAAVAGLADHLDVGLGVEDHAEAGADELLVVRDQDADHRAVSCERQPRAHRVAAAVARAGLEHAAVERDPLAHADQPVAASRSKLAGAPEPSSTDLELERRGAVPDDDLRLGTRPHA